MGHKRAYYPIDDYRFLFTKEETAKALGVGLSNVNLQLSAGKLVGRRIGRRVLVERSSIEAFIAGLPRV